MDDGLVMRPEAELLYPPIVRSWLASPLIRARLPSPRPRRQLTVNDDGEVFTLRTDLVELRYNHTVAGSFSAASLEVKVKQSDNTTRVWRPSTPDDSGNLFGTFRTLDGNSGCVRFERCPCGG
jgi:hypothetical protein